MFNVLARNAKKVRLEMYIGGEMFTSKLKRFKDVHWKSSVLYISPEKEVKYRYVITPNHFLSWFSQELYEQEQRSISSSVNQYDVFKDSGDTRYSQHEFEGNLYYISELYLLVRKESFKELLLDCELMGFDRYNLTYQERQQFSKWLKECTQVPLNPYQALFLIVLLGRVAIQKSFSGSEKLPSSTADAILNSIEECSASVLPSNSTKYLEAAARVLIPASSTPSYLYLLASLCWLIPTANLIRLAKERCINSRERLNPKQSCCLIDKFLRKLGKADPNPESDSMTSFVISRIQSFSILLYFYESWYKIFQSTRERDRMFFVAFTKHIDDAISADGDHQHELVQRWSSLDQELRHTLSVEFTKAIIKKLDGNSVWWKKQRTVNLCDLLLKEEIWSGKDMLPIIERLVKSGNEQLCNLFLQLLHSTHLKKWWSSVSNDKHKKLCTSWLQVGIKKRQHWRTSKEIVLELLKDLERLCSRYQLQSDDSLKDVLGEYTLKSILEMGLNCVLDAFHDVEELPDLAKKYYVQSVIELLRRKKDVMCNIKDVLRTFGRVESNRKPVGLYVPK